MAAAKRSDLLAQLLVICLALGALLSGYANPRDAGTSAQDTKEEKKAEEKYDKDKDKDKDQDKDKDKEAQKLAVRNNAASLLADLLGDEKNVSKVLIIKHPPSETGDLIKTISKTADDGSQQLTTLAKADNALKLDAMQLPPGEKDARDAEAKTKEHELLFSSGTRFEFSLLLTQAQALSYGAHLAKVAADNSPGDSAKHEFEMLQMSLSDLYDRVVARMRALPPDTKS